MNKKLIFIGLFFLFFVGFVPSVQAQKPSKVLLSSKNNNSDVCESAEPQGMKDSYQKCSLECKTVCKFEKQVKGVNCFKCEEGGDDTCADIGAFEEDYEWCQPGGICYSDPMLYCKPFEAAGPNRSKLKCTNCKQRADMCWQKVEDGTTTFTNCKLGCWNGTCKYKGKYTEKEWDGKDEYIHCYECVTPPPPPTCEDMKWGYDWEDDCLDNCAEPGYCVEILMPKKGAKKGKNKGGKEEEDGKKKGKKLGPTGTKGGDKKKGKNKVPRANPPIAGANISGGGTGRNNENQTKTKPKDPCEGVVNNLKNLSVSEEEPLPPELQKKKIERQKKNMERFKKSLAKLRDYAEKVKNHLKNGGGERERASLMRSVAKLQKQAMRDLYRADPEAKQTEAMARVDQYYEANRDLSRLTARRKMSDRIFSEKARALKSKIAKGGSRAEGYQRQLDNLNRGKKAYDKSLNSRERNLKQSINAMQKQNGRDGVGPFDQRGLEQGMRDSIWEIEKKFNKLKRLRNILEKADKNNCPPKGADKAVKKLDKQIKDMEGLIKNLNNRLAEIENGYSISKEDKQSIEANINRVAEGTKKMGGVKSMSDFYLESQAEELARTFDPTDPRVGLKKAFWYSVGVVEGVYESIKGLVKLGVGALDLMGETAAKYAGYEDGGIFGTDASKALQSVLGGVDGNINLDGLEKLAQGVDKAISKKLKQLSRAKDLDKTVSRAGGRVAGEVVVGDAVISGVLGKAGKVLRGAKELKSGSRIRKGLESVDELKSGSRVRKGLESAEEAGLKSGVKTKSESKVKLGKNKAKSLTKKPTREELQAKADAASDEGLKKAMDDIKSGRAADDLGEIGEDILGVGSKEAQVGSLSKDLTPKEIEELFKPGANLTKEQIMQKADYLRAKQAAKKSEDLTKTQVLGGYVEDLTNTQVLGGKAEDLRKTQILGGAVEDLKETQKLQSGTRIRKGLESGKGASNAPPQKPDLDGIPSKTPKNTPDSKAGKQPASKVDDAPKSSKRSPKKPRGPPPVAKKLDNTKELTSSGRKAKPLDESVAIDLELKNGFRRDHADNMYKFAQEQDAYLIVRDGNPDSVKYMKNPDMMPKPVTSKAKTAKVGPEKTNRGLVVDPTHPTQAKYWDDAIADAANAGDIEKLNWLKENRRKAINSWNDYGEKMKKNGYFVQDNGVIGYKDPNTGKVYKGVHGDYDLHGVYKANPDGTVVGRTSFGEGKTVQDGAVLRNQLNRKIDPNKEYVQHGAQDDWVPDPKYVPNKPPDPPVVVFMPDGSPPVKLKTAEDMKKFYEERMGIKWEYPDKK